MYSSHVDLRLGRAAWRAELLGRSRSREMSAGIDDVRARVEANRCARAADGVRRARARCRRCHGAEVFLKFENHQFTASFKERGALNRLLMLADDERRRGVIAMSAGNHAQAVAYHGGDFGYRRCIVMPRFTPNAKVEQTRVFGADVTLFGSQFEEARAFALDARAGTTASCSCIHTTIRWVIAGQGTLGLEMLEQMPDSMSSSFRSVAVGSFPALRSRVKTTRPAIESDRRSDRALSVRASDAFTKRRSGTRPNGGTVAEGIAVKAPGALTTPLIRAVRRRHRARVGEPTSKARSSRCSRSKRP